MGKKICFSFNHLQYSDGVARAALSMANRLAEEKDCDVTLRPIFISPISYSMAIFNCYIHVIALKKTCLLYSLLNKQVFFKCIILVLEGYTIKSRFFHRVSNSMKFKIRLKYKLNL